MFGGILILFSVNDAAGVGHREGATIEKRFRFFQVLVALIQVVVVVVVDTVHIISHNEPRGLGGNILVHLFTVPILLQTPHPFEHSGLDEQNRIVARLNILQEYRSKDFDQVTR